MWSKLIHYIYKFKTPLFILLIIATVGMAFFAKDISLSYAFDKIIPKNHPKYIEYEQFIDQYGEDGNILLAAVQTDRFYEKDFLQDWYELGQSLEKVEAVQNILSPVHAYKLGKDTLEKRFFIEKILKKTPDSPEAATAFQKEFRQFPFYKNLLYNDSTKVYLMAIAINPKVLDTKARNPVVANILKLLDEFGAKQKVDLHYSGLPYLRVFRTTAVTKEIRIFTILSVIFALGILILLFRSLKVIIFPLFVFGIGLIGSIGLIVLMGFKMNILTGLIPPIIVIISIPNCVYLLNRYIQELKEKDDREAAILSALNYVGWNIFFANLTTAIGFSVFAFMESNILKEFGLVSGCSIALLFLSSIICIPFLLSVLPKNWLSSETKAPQWISGLLDRIIQLVVHHKGKVQIIVFLFAALTTLGIIQLEAKGYIFDDVSKDSPVYKDLKFFEQHFKGVLPLDIIISLNKKKAITKQSNLKRIDKLNAKLAEHPLLSRPLSITDGIKFMRQGFFNGNDQDYKLPTKLEQGFLFKYLANSRFEGDTKVLSSFTDSTQSVARISMQMADVGSQDFPKVLAEIQEKVEKVFPPKKYKTTYTGTSLIAIEGYNYLVNGLITSVLLAFLLITIVVVLLFRDLKMLLIALIPNVIPLMTTAAMMGLAGITLKPSTVLIFSVAFGISVDFTIHFLTKYRQERQKEQATTITALHTAIQETGLSMLYTAIILFFGFIIFSASEFQGTFYLGLLTSFTIIIALFANLVLLPSLLLQFYKD